MQILEQMNAAMRPYRAAAEPLLEQRVLAGGLSRLVQRGFVNEDECLFFAENFSLNKHLLVDPSRAGREAVINKVHLDDHVDMEAAGWAEECLTQGLLLARAVLPALGSFPLQAVISIQEPEPSLPIAAATFRFYLRRPSDPWLVGDRDQFPEPVLVVEGAQGR